MAKSETRAGWGSALGRAVVLWVLALSVSCGGDVKRPLASSSQPQPRVVPSAKQVEEPRGNEPPLPESCEHSSFADSTFSADGSLFVVRLATGIRAYDTASWAPRATELRIDEMASFRLTPDGGFLFGFVHPKGLAPSPSGHLEALDTRTGKRVWSSKRLEGELYEGSLVIASDGSWFAVAVTDDKEEYEFHVELFGLPSFELLGRFDMPTKVTRLRRPAWRPRVLPKAPTVHGVQLSVPNSPPDWSLDKVDLQPLMLSLASSPDASSLAIGWMGNGAATSLIDVRKARLRETLPGSYFAFSPKGRFLMLDQGSGARALYDTKTGKGALFYDPLCPPQGNVFKPSFNPDETLVALASLQSNACLVETKTGRLRGLAPPRLPTAGAFEDEGIIIPGAWLSDGSGLLMAVSTSGELALFELGASAPKPLGAGLRRESAVADNGLSYPVVVRRGTDQSLFVFTESGYPGVEIVGGSVRSLSPPEGDVRSVVVDPDGERYARTDAGGTTVRSTRTNEPSLIIEGTSDLEPSFDPTGRWLYSADSDRVSVWDASSGRSLLALRSCPK
ncbi:MAG: WD40 repeat domain-containing protein [Polyangiaceae bacterium]